MIECPTDAYDKIEFTDKCDLMMTMVLHFLHKNGREIFLWPQTLLQKLWFVLALMYPLETEQKTNKQLSIQILP